MSLEAERSLRILAECMQDEAEAIGTGTVYGVM